MKHFHDSNANSGVKESEPKGGRGLAELKEMERIRRGRGRRDVEVGFNP
jgi:hypothetical protein